MRRYFSRISQVRLYLGHFHWYSCGRAALSSSRACIWNEDTFLVRKMLEVLDLVELLDRLDSERSVLRRCMGSIAKRGSFPCTRTWIGV